MNGKRLVTVFLGLIALMGIGLFYAQNYAFYERVEGLETIDVQGQPVAVRDYVGIDATSSGLKRRGCFVVDPQAFAGFSPAEAPEPLNPPYWFDCFETEQLARDIEAGRALAFVAEVEEMDGIDRLVAVYPDGRAFEWRQLNERFAK